MRLPKAFFLLAAATAFAAPTSASVVTDTGGTNLLRIDGLTIGTTVYDVTFMSGSYDDVFGAPLFLGNEAGAMNAANLIRDELNDYEAGAVPLQTIVGVSPGNAVVNGQLGIVVPFTNTVEVFTAEKSTADPVFRTLTATTSQTGSLEDLGLVWAKFAEVRVVPEPGALVVWCLLGLGFAGGALCRHR